MWSMQATSTKQTPRNWLWRCRAVPLCRFALCGRFSLEGVAAVRSTRRSLDFDRMQRFRRQQGVLANKHDNKAVAVLCREGNSEI